MGQLLSQAIDKAVHGQRLNKEEALALYYSADFLALGELAFQAKKRISGNEVYFNVNRHINLSNICIAKCPLCAFARSNGDQNAFALESDKVLELVNKALADNSDLTEIHMVSSLNPDRPYAYYLEVIGRIRQSAPNCFIKAFTPVEILHFSQISGKSVEQVLYELQEAGLDFLPGGGAEILDDTIRQKICPNKASSQEWINVNLTAHKLGIKTNATMLYGHIETIEQRIDHILTIRDLQDKTGGFLAFIAFPFHPDNTGLSHIKRASAWEDLKMIAIARLLLDNIKHIKAFWMMLTLPIAQIALIFGADDLDGTVVEEKIIHAAGSKTASAITKEKLIAIIKETGSIAVERDTFYHQLERYDKEKCKKPV